ncbi:hypothetical protein SNE40_021553 [Patella caerulea]|uniref:Uncharacterized protein n=1 Tax=Patella caerulea TaxID=87958 RepID=A0AAN8IZ73_PATCE
MVAEDESFYRDNCLGDYVATSLGTVSRRWLKQKRRVEDRSLTMEAKRAENEDKVKSERMSLSRQIEEAMQVVEDDELGDEDFTITIESPNTSHLPGPATRSTTSIPKTETEFPQVKVRTGRTKLSEPLMRALVQCLSEYKVTANDLLGIAVTLANTVFGQKWQKSGSDSNGDPKEDMGCEPLSSDDEGDCDPLTLKRSKRDLTFVMPSRKCMSMYLQDASVLNLEMVARKLTQKNSSTVVTVGIDDATKAAGHRHFHVKTDHITLKDRDSGIRETFTTGYVGNPSHTGESGADAYHYKLQWLAILADTSVNDMKQMIDFWITDRAGDCSTMLEHLGVSDDKKLKCSAHIVLAVDHALEKVFKDVEQKVGIEKLIRVNNILKSNSSIHTLGLIAVAKLLSPSHASHSVSLFTEFKDWLDAKGLNWAAFKGFVSICEES